MVTQSSSNTPTGASGTLLQGQGIGTANAFTVATYPSVATTAGGYLQATGSNWTIGVIAFPFTSTINEILYSSANNQVAGITAVNDGVLISSNTGVPSFLPNGTTGQVLTATTGSPPSWDTMIIPTLPVPLADGGTAASLVATANSTFVTDGSGVVSFGTSLSNDFTYTSATSGVTRVLTVSNSSNTASSQAQMLLSVAGGSAGDAWTQYSVGSTSSYAIGIDNSTNDNLNFNYSASGTVSPSSGTITLAYSPSGGTSWTANAELFLISRATVGSFIQLALTNTDAGNTSSSARNAITAQAAAGDPYVLWDITGGTAYEMGVDNSASDVLQIYASASNAAANLNGTLAWQMTAAGEVTMPAQPAFQAYNNSTQSNVTGDATLYSILFNTEIFDQGGDFASSTFTAPVTGKYSFSYGYQLDQMTSGTVYQGYIATSNTTFNTYYYQCGAGVTAGIESSSLFCEMDAGDTCVIQVRASNITKVVDIPSGQGSCFFSGYLAC